MEMVNQVWNSQAIGTPLFKVVEKLKRARRRLIEWNKGVRARKRTEASSLFEKLEEC